MIALFIKNSGKVLGGVETSNKYVEGTNLDKEFEGSIRTIPIDSFSEMKDNIKSLRITTCIIESNLFVTNAIEDLYNIIKSTQSIKYYIRLNSSILGYGNRTNLNGCEFDDFTDKVIQKLKYLSLCSNNIGFIVLNETDYYLMKSLGFNDNKLIELPRTTFNCNTDKIIIKNSKMHKLLYVSGYYSKEKGIMSVLHAINSTNEGEFEWHIVSPFNRTEYLYDYTHLRALFDHVLSRSDVIIQSPTEDIKSLYESCDTVLIPAYFETHSFTVWEALSWDCNIIALNSMNLPWMKDDRVFLVDVNDFNYMNAGIKIAELIHKVNNNEEITKILRSPSEIVNRYLLSRYDSTKIDNKLQYFG